MRHPRFGVKLPRYEFEYVICWSLTALTWLLIAVWLLGSLRRADGGDPVPVAWAWELERVKAAGNPVSPGAARPDQAPTSSPPAPVKQYYRDAGGVYWELPDQAPGVAQSPFPGRGTTPGTTAPPAGWPSTTRPAPGRSPGVTYTAVPPGTYGGTTTNCVGYG